MTPADRQQSHWRGTRLSLVLAFLIGLLLLQLWLLAGALEIALGGGGSTLVPVIVVSGLCFLASYGLSRVLGRIPRGE